MQDGYPGLGWGSCLKFWCCDTLQWSRCSIQQAWRMAVMSAPSDALILKGSFITCTNKSHSWAELWPALAVPVSWWSADRIIHSELRPIPNTMCLCVTVAASHHCKIPGPEAQLSLWSPAKCRHYHWRWGRHSYSPLPYLSAWISIFYPSCSLKLKL